MPAQDLWFSLTGEVPGLPFPLAKSKLNEALGAVYDESYWSFQIKTSGWLTPGLLFASGTQSSGTITATAYSNQIIGNATAAALWAAYSSMPLLTQCQIRSPFYALYDIVAFDGVNTFTLDRPWMEPSGTGLTYMIYQAYFPVPVADFKRFFAVRDTTMNAPIDYWSQSQQDLSLKDPQRTIFNLPACAVPFDTDSRTGSATPGYMRYELWPHPLSVLPYAIAYMRRGPLLTLPADTVPSPLTEELIMWRAKEVAYQWAEAQKGTDIKRGSGADYRFLAEAARAEYDKRLKTARDRDRDLYELYFTRFVRGAGAWWNTDGFYSMNGQLNVGR